MHSNSPPPARYCDAACLSVVRSRSAAAQSQINENTLVISFREPEQ
jgi:hypothetical protein